MRLGKFEINLPLVIHRRFHLLHPVNLLQLGLGLCRLGVLGAETIHELHQPPDFAFLILERGEELFFVGFALFEVVVVVAAVTDELALADFHDAANEPVEKFAVVRDDDNRAGIILQIILKPEQRLEVEMIRRFVEHQQVRLLHEQPREVRAHHPAAAHFARGPLEVALAETQAGENLLGLRFEPVAAQLVEAVMHIVVNFLRMQRLDRVIRFPRLDDAAQLHEIRRDGRGEFNHSFVAGHRGFLRQVTERDAALTAHLAIIRRFRAEDDGKERGLPRAVRTDQPDAVLAIHLQRGLGEQNLPAVRLADAGKSQHEGAESTR